MKTELIGVSLCLLAWGCDGEPQSAAAAPATGTLRLGPREALSGGAVAGFARADRPRAFEFPADHGPHPEFRTEWWYATGNLEADSGRRFGYQLTVFRHAMRPGEPDRESAWATHSLWFAHFGLTDVDGGELHGEERFARGALGLAGATTAPFRAWLEDWEFAGGPDAADPLVGMRVRASTAAGDGVALTLRPTKARVLQGDAGLSQKSSAAGNASYYYSYTRLATEGTVRVGGAEYTVRGASWFDREWSTSALAPDQVGWDWFALQLDDGRDLMFYRLRRTDGSVDPVSAGVLVDRAGGRTTLSAAAVNCEVLRRWESPVTAARYPVAWRLRVPDFDLDLRVAAVFDDQEHDFLVRYWEGAVDVAGSHAGRGYLEMTGYDGESRR